MTIFIGADHRGFELKDKLIEYLHEKNIRIEDLGNYQHDPQDDYPKFAKKVAQAVSQNFENYLGIVICGSGAGVDIAANRTAGIRCGLGFDVDQVRHFRENDHVNVLALAADYLDFEKAKALVDVFLEAQPKKEERFLRRIKQIDEPVK
ncbi:RpiB/LacA/LacB family sugar-phosphate isomerase [Candidatus Roizmanbacteria bacterium]|nr:RpiB/LacA/LacB family sugar-phosphate isomerase [Candidatus Roizmanbacteria bacterium]